MDRPTIIWMLLVVVVLATLPSLQAKSEGERYVDLLIDCGATQETNASDYSVTSETWKTDKQFIKHGENKLLSFNQSDMQFNTLRFFPKGDKHCYKLPFFYSSRRYIFRAGFYYGNYDGLLKPPSFGLEIDGNMWANVTTSMSQEPIYYELLHIIKKDEATVCLIRAKDDETPFISSLEATEINSDMYELMENDKAMYLHERINFGANQSVQKTIGPYEEQFNRIWKSKEMPNYLNIHANTIPLGCLIGENRPPWPVMAYAIQANNLTDSLYLSVNFSPRTSVQAYFVFYFMDVVYRPPGNVTSKVEIYIDNNLVGGTVIPREGQEGDEYHVVSLFPVAVSGSANVTIAPAKGSTLAPLLNAMEVFSAIEVSDGGQFLSLSTLSIILLQLLLFFVF